MVNISAIVTTHNNESNIEQCIISLQGIADEIIVVGALLSGATKEVCLSHNIRFFEQYFLTSDNRPNKATELTAHQYVIWLNSDECLSPELRKSILEVKANWTHDTYMLKQLNSYCGKTIRYGKWNSGYSVRLWDKSKQNYSPAINQKERLQQSTTVKPLKGSITRSTYGSIAEHLEQSARQADLWAKEAAKQNIQLSILKGLLSYPVQFITSCFLKLGFLDRPYGVILSDITAYESFLKYKKLRMYKKQLAKEKEVKSKPHNVHPAWINHTYADTNTQQKIDKRSEQPHILPISKK